MVTFNLVGFLCLPCKRTTSFPEDFFIWFWPWLAPFDLLIGISDEKLNPKTGASDQNRSAKGALIKFYKFDIYFFLFIIINMFDILRKHSSDSIV
jgi:hypothetical protein